MADYTKRTNSDTIVLVIAAVALILMVSLWFLNPNQARPLNHPILQWLGIGIFVVGVLNLFVENPLMLVFQGSGYTFKPRGENNFYLILLGGLIWLLSH